MKINLNENNDIKLPILKTCHKFKINENYNSNTE